MSDFREEEALGKAYDSQLLRRLMTYLRPYKWSVVFAVVPDFAGRPARSCWSLPVRIRRGQVHRPRAPTNRFPGRLRCAASASISLAFACSIAAELRGAIFASPDHAERRAADALRSAQRNLRAHAAPADEFLRPQPGGAPGDARDDGCRRAERSVCRRNRGHGQRRHRAALHRRGDDVE